MIKILIVMGGFFPGRKYGGPPVSVDNFCSLMKEELDCYIITHNHDMDETTPYHGIQDGWNDRSNAKVLYLPDNDYCMKTFDKVIREISPDFIYLQGLFQKCVFPCLWLAKKYHVKVVLAPRGELCSGALKKKYKKLPYIATLRVWGLLDEVEYQSTSDEETEAIGKYLGAEFNRIHLLSNIPSVPANSLQKHFKKRGEGRFIFVSRILWKKNLLGAISYINGVEGKVIFDIYGPKEDLNYWLDCERAIGELPDNIKVEYKGVLNHDDIHRTFSLYDGFLFPTFSENYGHVIAEALVSGCIPIISDQTPWTDINEFGAGRAIPLEKKSDFAKAIQEIVDMDNDMIQRQSARISNYLDGKLRIKELKKEYLHVFK